MKVTRMMPWVVLLFTIFVSCRSANTPSLPPTASATQQSSAATAPANTAVPIWTYEVVNAWPHDTTAYTQGLIYADGIFYESTGLYGRSTLRKVEPQSGKVLKKVPVASEYFAEGMTLFKGKIYQLTWQHQKGFIYEPENFQRVGEFSYTGEGWGLTHDDQSLILSDGSNQLRFLNPDNFKVERTISITYQGRPVNALNELEYIRGEIYANIWQSDQIVRIDPKSGRVVGLIDLRNLLPGKREDEVDDVLNGIAYDEKEQRIFITGKRWPKLFEVRFKVK